MTTPTNPHQRGLDQRLAIIKSTVNFIMEEQDGTVAAGIIASIILTVGINSKDTDRFVNSVFEIVASNLDNTLLLSSSAMDNPQ